VPVLDPEADALLAFARAARVPGGFAWLDAGGRPDPAQGLPLWITARMTHVFALAALLGRPEDGELADHGVQALATTFADDGHGGWWSEVRDGRPAGERKEAYPHAFVLLAASSARIAGRPGAPALWDAAAEVVAGRFWREEEGAFAESFGRAWTDPEPYRGANANMHMVEACLAAADASGDPAWAGRALRTAERIVHREARAHGWRVVEHFDADWRPLPDYNEDAPRDPFRPYGVTPGHGLEWARLLVHLRAALPDPPAWLLEAARGLFARALRDGWEEPPGGIVYTTDLHGAPVVGARDHERGPRRPRPLPLGGRGGRRRRRRPARRHGRGGRRDLAPPAAGLRARAPGRSRARLLAPRARRGPATCSPDVAGQAGRLPRLPGAAARPPAARAEPGGRRPLAQRGMSASTAARRSASSAAAWRRAPGTSPPASTTTSR
jgi:mannose/cellobiose epimerase-like protein (N-acyl-D-glucosamine 2-epimerase family)